MQLLTKYESFEALKSSKNKLHETPLSKKELSNDFTNFISILQNANKSIKQQVILTNAKHL